MTNAERDMRINEITGEMVFSRYDKTVSSSWESKRHLTQYRNMTDEEFEEAMAKKDAGIAINKVYETRIKRKIDALKEDYDFDASDLKPNDWNLIRSLAQCEIDLDDLNLKMYNARQGEVWDVMEYEKLARIRADLIKSVSSIQEDLQIVRRIRKNDKETSMISEIQKAKDAARKFVESHMKIVICPKCNKWIATFWFLYPGAKKNKIIIDCQTTDSEGKKCGEIIVLEKDQISTMVSSNKEELLPISLR